MGAHQRTLHSLKCTAWVAIFKHGINGPFWFEDVNEHYVTINTDQYVQVLCKFWTALGGVKDVVRVRQWFQQDGATPHTSEESLVWLNKRISGRLISHKRDPYSPDLTSPQIFISWDILWTRSKHTTPKVFLT